MQEELNYDAHDIIMKKETCHLEQLVVAGQKYLLVYSENNLYLFFLPNVIYIVYYCCDLSLKKKSLFFKWERKLHISGYVSDMFPMLAMGNIIRD